MFNGTCSEGFVSLINPNIYAAASVQPAICLARLYVEVQPPYLRTLSVQPFFCLSSHPPATHLWPGSHRFGRQTTWAGFAESNI